MNEITVIKSQLRSIEAQLRVLEARMAEASAEPPTGGRSFAQLYGVLHGQADTTEDEIDSVLYKSPTDLEDED
jgi:hypothetical protein